MLNTEGLKQFIELNDEINQTKEKLKILQEKKTAMTDTLVTNMECEDMENVKIAGRKVYLHEQIWAKISNKAKAIQTIKKLYPELITETFNTNQISSLIRELLSNDKLPQEFEGNIDYIVKKDLRVRAA